MKRNTQYKPDDWPPLLKQLAIVNNSRHAGTIKSSAFIIHTLVKQYEYTIYIYNPSKNIFENIGNYRYLGEDSLNYRFIEVKSNLSNIEWTTITLPKMCDDRYFFQAINSYSPGGVTE